MAQKTVNYEKLLRDASISVVKQVLNMVSREGFAKKQHLYITFAQNHPDVRTSEFLKNEFGDEITIVLQHDFWELTVDDYGFSVGLSFDHSDESIYVPFAALISINDPSENFSLGFIPDFSDRNPNSTQDDKTSGNIISFSEIRQNK